MSRQVADRHDMVMFSRCIAIDGASASGKSSVGFRVAHALGYLFFDTGILFRAVCWALLQDSSPISSTRMNETAEALQVQLRPPAVHEIADGRTTTVRMDGQDVTWNLRSPEVDQLLPTVSANPGVRHALTIQMREIGLDHLENSQPDGGVVIIGRDIGTVVFPDAGCKLFLDADLDVRARRRYRELAEQGKPTPLATVREDMQNRDHQDATRAVAPSVPAANADIIDTTDFTLEETVAEILSRLA